MEMLFYMKILAIETSCDDTAAAVVENGRNVLSTVVSSQVKEHALYGGVVPEIASRRHAEFIVSVTQMALLQASVSIDDIDAVAVTYAPGLIGSLLVGVNFAKGMSFLKNLPLIAVHHLRSHIASNYISYKELCPPFMCLVASGGHSHIVEVTDYTKMKVIGKTRDDAAGEAFDKAARCMGLPYPGGVHMDKMAELGDPNSFKLPHPSLCGQNYDFSFSGLKTAMINQVNNLKQKNINIPINDLCASFRKTVVDCLTDKIVQATKDFGYKKIVLAGGVSANTLLRKSLESECQKYGWKFYRPELIYCGDNAAMVGSQAYYEYLDGNISDMSLNAYATKSIEL